MSEQVTFKLGIELIVEIDGVYLFALLADGNLVDFLVMEV